MSTPGMPPLSPWYPAAIKPARVGIYRVQDYTMSCHCCWIEAYWNGAEWHTRCRCFDRMCGRFNVLMLDVKRWRGLRANPNKHPAPDTPKDPANA